MAVLKKELQDKIDAIEDLAYAAFEKGNIEETFKLSQDAWNLYPEPKENWNEAYNSAMYVVDMSFRVKDFNRAKEWLNKMINVNNNLHQSDDELEYYLGKYYFETSKYREALFSFKEVVEEAGFRYFENDDPKYLEFYRNPKKYME